MKTPSQTERILREIETQLIEGVWAPGERIPGERKLAESMGARRARRCARRCSGWWRAGC